MTSNTSLAGEWSKNDAAHALINFSGYKQLQGKYGRYIGYTRNNKPHGYGVLTCKDGKEISGQFKNGQPVGKVTIDFSKTTRSGGKLEVNLGDKEERKWVVKQARDQGGLHHTLLKMYSVLNRAIEHRSQKSENN